MATHKLLLLPGDGIGPEVMGEVKRLIDWLNAQGIAHFETEQGLVGGAAYDASKQSITDATMAKAMAADAVIFGAVGGPKWDSVPYEARPEAGLLRLRKELGLFANLRPAVCYPALADASSLKREVVEGLDIMIVRELTGGVYFGEPKNHHRSRQRPEARDRYPGLRHLRDRAHRARRVRSGAQAPQQADLDGKAQRDEIRRAVERSGRPGSCARIQGCAARASARRLPAG
jgi:isocitrate/isopropylmalate dehydrogenase